MPNYQDGKIYKITAGNLTYFGSTTQPLSKRLAQHRSDKKVKPNSNMSSFPLLDMPDCKIILVEDYPCERREQLLAREAYYIENYECVNKNKPFCEISKLRTKTTNDNIKKQLEFHNKQYEIVNNMLLANLQINC
jgi:Uri superfamily endonuclease